MVIGPVIASSNRRWQQAVGRAVHRLRCVPGAFALAGLPRSLPNFAPQQARQGCAASCGPI